MRARSAGRSAGGAGASADSLTEAWIISPTDSSSAPAEIRFDRIAAALFPKQKRIKELLECDPSAADSFPAALAECCVLNAYCKRKSNLMLLSEENLPCPNRELFLATQESVRFLKYCGIDAAATGEEYADFSLPQIHALYDAFENVIEAFLPYMHRMTVSLAREGMRLAVETDQNPSMPKTDLPIEMRQADGCTFLTIRAEGGAGR